MTTKTYKFSDLKKDPKLRRQVIELMSKKRRPSNDALDRINSRIKEFENKFQFDSDLVVTKLKNGEIEDSQEVCSWLMLIGMKSRVTKALSGEV